MVAADLGEHSSLAELLSARARRTPRDRLVLDIVGGLLVAAVAVWARPGGWVVLTAAATCFVAYGAWALAELKLLSVPWPERVPREGLWRALQGGAAFLGVGAFILLLFAGLGVGLGSIKS